MVIAGFQIQDKLGRARFFQETFLVVDTSMEVVFGIPFLTLSNADIGLQKGNLPRGLIPLQRPYPPPRESKSLIEKNSRGGTGSKQGSFRSSRNHPHAGFQDVDSSI